MIDCAAQDHALDLRSIRKPTTAIPNASRLLTSISLWLARPLAGRVDEPPKFAPIAEEAMNAPGILPGTLPYHHENDGQCESEQLR